MMKRRHREREIAARDIANWDEVRKYIATQFDKMVALYRRQYGHLFTTTWWYESEWCPCCGRRPVGLWANPEGQTALSLNGWIYRERQVLIGYLLCRRCVEDLTRASPAQEITMHRQIEGRLRAAYQQALGAGS